MSTDIPLDKHVSLSGRKAMRSDNFKSGVGGGTGRGQAGILSTLSGRRTMRSDNFKSHQMI